MFTHLAVLATPGSFHGWIADALQGVLTHSGLLKERRPAESDAFLQSFTLSSPSTGEDIEVTLATFGGLSLCDEIRAGSALGVIVDEPLPSAAAALEADGICSVQQAVRAVTNAKALYWELLRSENVDPASVQYHPLSERADALRWLEALASTLDSRLMAPSTGAVGPCRDALAALKQDLQHKLGWAPLPTSALVRGDWIGMNGFSIDLHPSFCVLGDSPTTPVAGAVDVTGPARILTGGPYVFLPCGLVYAEFRFEVSAELNEEPFRLSVYNGSTELRSNDFVVDALRPMCVRFSFENPCSRSPVDVHLLNLKGQIDGMLAIQSIGFADRPWS